ncbi:MAG: hypothetical protein EBV32_06290 [Proteobacteria bacterium]|uniref:Uncharacterized protein n=1 Tax=Candidatus Fonsibacter lacus TaxID=2576439 RepID=A0A964V204_9PROT|nr:hypothetical protein [Candidatus Fonsibacter lacus]NBP60585.1 hypothetical protein [Pseudomonadota bacterium]NCU72694.1 hypothetical protein [Candidatus Fonsibacter lacus]
MTKTDLSPAEFPITILLSLRSGIIIEKPFSAYLAFILSIIKGFASLYVINYKLLQAIATVGSALFIPKTFAAPVIVGLYNQFLYDFQVIVKYRFLPIHIFLSTPNILSLKRSDN